MCIFSLDENANMTKGKEEGLSRRGYQETWAAKLK
jgi:hypothetical protein